MTLHWVIQNNLINEVGILRLLEVLSRERYTFSVHRVTPFVGEIEPDISPEGDVMVIGSYALRHVSKKKGWKPGVFDLDQISHQNQVDGWGKHLLNSDAVVCRFDEVSENFPPQNEFFIRPERDGKQFAGSVTTRAKFLYWKDDIMKLDEDESGLKYPRSMDNRRILGSSIVVVGPVIKIFREYRFWIVKDEIVTYSLYKMGDNVIYKNEADPDTIEFVEFRIKQWSPADAYVMDVALTENGYKILEINTLNSSGFYAADIEKLVYAIGRM